MVSVLVSVESFPGSPQVWEESVCVAIALVLPDSSIEGECLVTDTFPPTCAKCEPYTDKGVPLVGLAPLSPPLPVCIDIEIAP